MTQRKTVRPMTLEIDKDTWEKFKEKTPRTTRLNDAVVCLIIKHVNNDNDNESNKDKNN